MNWAPHVTVAVVIERDGRYLLVHELSEGEMVYNQPAGHLEPGETLQQAAIREAKEETGWDIQLTGIIGFSLYTSPQNGITYYRTTFLADAIYHNADAALDKDIEEAVWLSYEEICRLGERLRSPVVLSVIEDYREGHCYPLTLLREF